MSPKRPFAVLAITVGVALIYAAMHISDWLAVPALVVGVALVVDVLVQVLSPSRSITPAPADTTATEPEPATHTHQLI